MLNKRTINLSKSIFTVEPNTYWYHSLALKKFSSGLLYRLWISITLSQCFSVRPSNTPLSGQPIGSQRLKNLSSKRSVVSAITRWFFNDDCAKPSADRPRQYNRIAVTYLSHRPADTDAKLHTCRRKPVNDLEKHCFCQ